MTTRPGWVLADIGNTRVKMAWLAEGADSVDRLFAGSEKTWDERLTLPSAGLHEHASALESWLESKRIGGVFIASVRPESAQELIALLDRIVADRPEDDAEGAMLSSAADVGLTGRMTRPEKTGADRALAVRAALRLHQGRGPGIVVLCGTAMTVERLDAEGEWLGGAIAPGYRLAAEALNQGTAGLMHVGMVPKEPFAYGTETRTAIEAGLFWGQVGAAKELIARSIGVQEHWQIWTGGDAPLIARWAGGPEAAVVQDLVLMGLADWAAAQSLKGPNDR